MSQLVVLFSCFAGWPFGAGLAHRISRDPEEIGSGQGRRHREICGAGTAGIVAWIQFALAGTRHEARRELLVEEANSIVTTGRRAQLLPEPDAANVAKLLREYVPVRMEAHRQGQFSDQFATTRKRSADLQDRMWAEAVAAAAERPSPIIASFIASLSETIDLERPLLELSETVNRGAATTSP